MESARYFDIGTEVIKIGVAAIIGRVYIYPGDPHRKHFKLKQIVYRGLDCYLFKFECGHSCTNCVFEDLILLDSEDIKQLQLF